MCIRDSEKVHEEGMLESFKLTEEAATMLIMQARVKAGWIDESALIVEEEEEEEEVVEADADAAPTAEDVFG